MCIRHTRTKYVHYLASTCTWSCNRMQLQQLPRKSSNPSSDRMCWYVMVYYGMLWYVMVCYGTIRLCPDDLILVPGSRAATSLGKGLAEALKLFLERETGGRGPTAPRHSRCCKISVEFHRIFLTVLLTIFVVENGVHRMIFVEHRKSQVVLFLDSFQVDF